jgi:CBS domain-containing protein
MTDHEPPRVSDYMTPLPITVETGMSLTDALDRMYSDNIRHLPVVDTNANLVGMLSTRDIAAASALRGLDPDTATVEVAMSTVPFTCADHSPLVAVVERMERERLGSAVVTCEGKPVGIFTTTDALRALRSQLLGKPVAPAMEPEIEQGEGSDKPVVHIQAQARRSDRMVSWFLTKF